MAAPNISTPDLASKNGLTSISSHGKIPKKASLKLRCRESKNFPDFSPSEDSKKQIQEISTNRHTSCFLNAFNGDQSYVKHFAKKHATKLKIELPTTFPQKQNSTFFPSLPPPKKNKWPNFVFFFCSRSFDP